MHSRPWSVKPVWWVFFFYIFMHAYWLWSCRKIFMQQNIPFRRTVPININPLPVLTIWLFQANVSANYVERGEMDRMRSELEGSTRLELNQKLEEVNTYLEEQSKAREKIDQMRDDNENVMKQEFEKSKKELMVGVEFLCVSWGWMNVVFLWLWWMGFMCCVLVLNQIL